MKPEDVAMVRPSSPSLVFQVVAEVVGVVRTVRQPSRVAQGSFLSTF